MHEIYETDDAIYIVMEHASGGELFDYIVACNRLKEREARQFFRQILSAVDYCHRVRRQPPPLRGRLPWAGHADARPSRGAALGWRRDPQSCVVHRDLKPENLLLDDKKRIKIIDFGFVNMFAPNEMLNTFCGSPYYAAPEMILGKHYEGPEVDVWSLGAAPPLTPTEENVRH